MWAYGRGQTDRHTDTHTDANNHNTFCVVYDSRKMFKYVSFREQKSTAAVL